MKVLLTQLETIGKIKRMSYKKLKPEIQGDKVVLREWVGDEPDLTNVFYEYALARWKIKAHAAPAYQPHPDHESYFRERIGVITDVEIVRGYIDEGKFYTITDSVGETERGEYAIPKQEDDLNNPNKHFPLIERLTANIRNKLTPVMTVLQKDPSEPENELALENMKEILDDLKTLDSLT